MFLTIVVPTVDGREDSLVRCLDAYNKTTPIPFVVHIFKNMSSCGAAWNEGLLQAKGDYIHFTADDLEPQQGWLEPLIETVDSGQNPAPIVLKPDGTVQSYGGSDFSVNPDPQPDGSQVDFSPIPFLSKSHALIMRPIPDLHYASDVWVSERLRRKADIQTVLRTESRFVHHEEQPGRGAGMTQPDRAFADQVMFAQYLKDIP